jgi:ATP-dependent Clp protease adaptor protein ClpS
MNDTTQVLPLEEQQTGSETNPRAEPLFNVVLLDDDEHTYEYVIAMLCHLFGHSVEQAYAMACEVDREGRVIVDTTHFERAELKRDQIRSYGADRLLHGSHRSMHATVEPLVG